MNTRLFFLESGFQMVFLGLGFILGAISPAVAFRIGYTVEKTPTGYIVNYERQKR